MDVSDHGYSSDTSQNDEYQLSELSKLFCMACLKICTPLYVLLDNERLDANNLKQVTIIRTNDGSCKSFIKCDKCESIYHFQCVAMCKHQSNRARRILNEWTKLFTKDFKLYITAMVTNTRFECTLCSDL